MVISHNYILGNLYQSTKLKQLFKRDSQAYFNNPFASGYAGVDQLLTIELYIVATFPIMQCSTVQLYVLLELTAINFN